MKKSRLLWLVCGFISVLFSIPTNVYAAVDVLYDPTLPLCSDVFSDSNCWLGGVVPGTGDNAIFNNAAVSPYTVNFTTTASNDNTIVQTDNLIWDLGFNSYSITTDLTVGDLVGDVASLYITNGIVSNQSGYIGRGSGPMDPSGTVTVDGVGSIWNNNSLEIGVGGNGTLEIKNGGLVTSTSSGLGFGGSRTGTVNVDGAGSLWNSGFLSTSYSGSTGGYAFINITNGGTVQSTSAVLARFEGFGTVTVDGVNSSWSISDGLRIGENREGTLNITNGGTVTSTGIAEMGYRTGALGLVTVDGVGSSWTNNGSLIVGGRNLVSLFSSGDGSVTIKNGGTLSTTDAYLANAIGNNGAVTVDGMGSRWTNSGNLFLGDYGSGNLYIQNGGVVSSASSYLGRFTGEAEHPIFGVRPFSGSGTASVDGNGSTWNNSDSLYVGGDETAAGGTGVINVGMGGTVNVTNQLRVWSDGTVTADGTVNSSSVTLDGGTLTGSGTINADFTNSNGGLVGPGNSPGLLTIDGNYNQDENSSLFIEIGGLFAGTEYDVLDISGTASLAGILDVDLYDLSSGLFSPSLGDSFDILMAETITGEFDFYTLAMLDEGLRWDVNYFADAIGSTDVVRLSVAAVPIPPALWLFGSGAIGLLFIARKRKTV